MTPCGCSRTFKTYKPRTCSVNVQNSTPLVFMDSTGLRRSLRSPGREAPSPCKTLAGTAYKTGAHMGSTVRVLSVCRSLSLLSLPILHTSSPPPVLPSSPSLSARLRPQGRFARRPEALDFSIQMTRPGLPSGMSIGMHRHGHHDHHGHRGHHHGCHSQHGSRPCSGTWRCRPQ